MTIPCEIAKPPEAVLDGEPCVRLLISVWRKIAIGQSDCPLVARELASRCGQDAGDILGAVFTFLQAMGYAGRRRLHIGHPGCVGVTGDECRLLAVIAAAQNDHDALFEAHLRWLARVERRPVAVIAALALAAALAAKGLRLAPPSPRAAAGPALRQESGRRCVPLLQLILNCHIVVTN